jgi:hypothetical protein
VYGLLGVGKAAIGARRQQHMHAATGKFDRRRSADAAAGASDKRKGLCRFGHRQLAASTIRLS